MVWELVFIPLGKDMNGVEQTLSMALAALENDIDRIKGLAGFEWIVSIPLNAFYIR